MGIQRRWRAWLTDSVVSRWLTNGRYYQLNLVGGDHKNPEYRVAEDLRVATDAPVDFASGVISAFLSAATFIVVLWTIGGAPTLTVGGSTFTVPGFLVAAVSFRFRTRFVMLIDVRIFVLKKDEKTPLGGDHNYSGVVAVNFAATENVTEDHQGPRSPV
jgi:putative ATP-binding cassette transporter